MKIKMITIHNIANYGSVFQAMALNRYLRKLGHDCEVIDYNPPYFTKGTLKARLGRLLNYRADRERVRKYRRFVTENMTLTQRSYETNRQLREAKEVAELFLAGGDQLWNEFYDCGKDDAYKLQFANGRKAAFGTSLGKDSFTPGGLERLVAAVNSFEMIGIREQSGVKLLRDAGLTQVSHVCDPVFLLEREEYEQFLQPVPVKEKYMFVYLVQQSPLLDAAVEYISKKLNLKVVLYAGFIPKCHSDVFIREMGPEETLSYVANAEFILSASFHASAFSTLFHKQFITLLPGKNTNARIKDFLHLTGLESRMVSDESMLETALASPIEWESVDQTLKKHIKESKAFLAKILGDASL